MFMAAFPILETSAKSVQTSAVVCTDYTCSLHRLRLSAALKYDVLVLVSMRTYSCEYVVLTNVFVRVYFVGGFALAVY